MLETTPSSSPVRGPAAGGRGARRGPSQPYQEETLLTQAVFKYEEDRLLQEVKDYIQGTYSAHYAGADGIQAFDLVKASGHGEGFLVGNIIKYASRYGKKGGHNRKDLIKIIHYAVMLLHVHGGESR